MQGEGFSIGYFNRGDLDYKKPGWLNRCDVDFLTDVQFLDVLSGIPIPTIVTYVVEKMRKLLHFCNPGK